MHTLYHNNHMWGHATARRWMRHLGFATKYLSQLGFNSRPECVWEEANLTIERTSVSERRVVVWHHDESIFYANDRRKARWVHKSENAVPYTKGKGASLMVADFVSADYGWLCSPDGKERARVLFKPGKNRDGYFDCEDIIEHEVVGTSCVGSCLSFSDTVLLSVQSCCIASKGAATSCVCSSVRLPDAALLRASFWGFHPGLRASGPFFDPLGRPRPFRGVYRLPRVRSRHQDFFWMSSSCRG